MIEKVIEIVKLYFSPLTSMTLREWIALLLGIVIGAIASLSAS